MEISYQAFRECEISRQIAEIVELEMSPYRARPIPPPRPYVKKKRDPRGSKKGVKRGHYKKTICPVA